MVILGTIMAVCITAIIEASRIERAESGALIETQVLRRLGRQIAGDVHASAGLPSKAEVEGLAGVLPAAPSGGQGPRFLLKGPSGSDEILMYGVLTATDGTITGVVRSAIAGGRVVSTRVTAVELESISWAPVAEGPRQIGVRTSLRLTPHDPRGRALNEREWFASFRCAGGTR